MPDLPAIPGDALAWLLIGCRILAVSWTAPALGTPGLDARIRIVLAALLTAILAPVVMPHVSIPRGNAAWLGAMASELLIGVGIGGAASLIIAGARQAGEVVGLQSGLSAASLFDPEVGDDLTPLGHLYGLIALAAFLAMDGPLAMVDAIAESYRVVPAASVAATPELATQAFGKVGESLALALRLAAPAGLALTLAGVALGLLGRAAPSMQLVALSLPVRFALGMVVVMLSVALVGSVMADQFHTYFQFFIH